VVDDRSGVCFLEYRCVYGEDAESALRFLFNAMAAKDEAEFPFQGRPKMIYLDNGPVAKSRVFQNVMQALGIDWLTHIPAGKDGERVTARSKGKVERPFRTVKDAHETLYHFHQPETEQQARPPHRTALAHRGLDRQFPARRYPGHVRLGAILPLRPRTGAAQSWHRCARLGGWHRL
jgi:hypothetical protein